MTTAQVPSRPAIAQVETSTPSFLQACGAWCFILLLIALAIFEVKAPNAAGATSPENEFSASRALAHVRVIAREAHPIGSNANTAVRDYLVAQLSALSMQPQVSTAIGVNGGFGAISVGNTRNIVARLPGTANSGAVLLMAHYDSVPNGPGAADDGAGVSAILETVRALKTGPALKNDLIVLFTDGEEPGLLGAEAFVASHPWMKDIGLVMNFEARGNRGASLLFETSVNNASLMNEVAHAAPSPIASSLFYSLYKLLPNSTDFNMFRPAGIPGLNFAFGGHLEAYHSGLDTPDNLDLSSVQHHGSYALALARSFGHADLGKLKQSRGADVFFNLLGGTLVTYGERWVVIGEVVATVLLLGVLVLGVRRGETHMRDIARAVLACFTILLVVPIVAAGAAWLLLRLLGDHLLVGDTPANAFLLIGIIMLAAALGNAILAKFRKRTALQELSLGGLIIACILSWIVAIILPAGSYLLFWPLLLATIGFLLLKLTGTGSARARMAAALPAAVMAIFLFAPIGYLLYIFLTLNTLSVAAISLLLGVFFIVCIPLVNMIVPQDPWSTVLLPLVGAAIICVGVGVVQSHASAQHPQQDHLLYSLNADDHTAVWASYDRAPDAYTAQFLRGTGLGRHSIPNYLTGSEWQVLSAPAPASDLQPPVSQVMADAQEGEFHNLRMNLKSQRDAYLLVLRFDPRVKIVSANVSGRSLKVRPDSSGPILLYGMGVQGADVELKLKASSNISFWLSDYSSGLPVVRHRSPEFIAAQGSDQTLVCRRYTLKSRNQ
jgi:hypothetical protein